MRAKRPAPPCFTGHGYAGPSHLQPIHLDAIGEWINCTWSLLATDGRNINWSQQNVGNCKHDATVERKPVLVNPGETVEYEQHNFYSDNMQVPTATEARLYGAYVCRCQPGEEVCFNAAVTYIQALGLAEFQRDNQKNRTC